MQRSSLGVRPREISSTQYVHDENGQQANTFIQNVTRTEAAVATAVASSGIEIKRRDIFAYVPRLIRNAKQWIMQEQVGVHWGSSAVLIVPLTYNNQAYVDLIGVFSPVGGGVVYPVYDQHMYRTYLTDGFTHFIAPQAGDYLVQVHLEMFFDVALAVTLGDYYVELSTSIRTHAGTWQVPVVIGGGTNVGIDNHTASMINISGWNVLRLGRGDHVRFGVLNRSPSGGDINSVTSNTMRVGITKQKFYPQLSA